MKTASPGASVVFLAALAPMITVTSLRRLLVDVHGGGPAHVHVFVAIGMIGAAIGAPIFAARADERARHLHMAACLASIDALVTLLTASAIPTPALFLLRPVHGAASMGLLALLFSRFRAEGGRIVSHAGAAMVAALAVGPALGGALGRTSPALPFRVAAAISLSLAVLLALLARRAPLAAAARTLRARLETRAFARQASAPLAVAFVQRFAIGGFVAAFAVQARAVHRMSDAAVGVCFSAVLVVFAAAVFVLGKRPGDPAHCVRVGGALFGAAFVALAFAPRPLLPLPLALAGAGAAGMYAPALRAVSALAPHDGRATAMALLHACGAAGMIAGPLVAATIDVALRTSAVEVRSAVFLTVAGMASAIVSALASHRFGELARLHVQVEETR